jgi:hypothetical protein
MQCQSRKGDVIMKIPNLALTTSIIIFCSSSLFAKIIHIPADYAAIQAGVNAASNGDTVLVAPGEYYEQIHLKEKTIILGSWFLTTGDDSYISRTVLHGGDSTVIKVNKTVGPATTIMGFTIRDGNDGINPRGKIRILHNHILGCRDGIDYERGSGGLCRYNVLENNNGEGLDLDHELDIVIEDNIIRNNGEDGIEIQLQEYSGPRLTYIIRRNLIYGNGQDGIQLVGYPGPSDRFFYIERNLIYNNAFSGLGCMGNGNDKENYEGASIRDPIYVVNNTFVGNNYGITGGDNLVALNNLIAGTKTTAMKNVDGNSIIAYGGFWANGVDFDNCNQDSATIVYGLPLLDENYGITAGSIGVDNGIAFFVWQGDTVLNISPKSYTGSAPDLGAFEYNLTDVPVALTIVPVISPGQIELIWRTGNEANLQGYEIQRSKDGIHVAKIAFVESRGNTMPAREYRYLDSGLLPGTYYYRLKLFSAEGQAKLSGVLSVVLPAPKEYALLTNYPNPFNARTSIEYHLPAASHVTLKIYNSLGQEVRTLADGERPAGYHVLSWNGRDQTGKGVASGIYFYELRVGSFRVVRQLMVLR